MLVKDLYWFSGMEHFGIALGVPDQVRESKWRLIGYDFDRPMSFVRFGPDRVGLR
jgi:hypothetical protein